MDEKSVPYIAFESEMARNERHIRRLWILVIILAVMLVGTNIGWLIYEAQFMDEVVTVESQTDGGGTEFARAVDGKEIDDVLPVLDELMTVLQAVHPRLYAGVMRKLQ